MVVYLSSDEIKEALDAFPTAFIIVVLSAGVVIGFGAGFMIAKSDVRGEESDIFRFTEKTEDWRCQAWKNEYWLSCSMPLDNCFDVFGGRIPLSMKVNESEKQLKQRVNNKTFSDCFDRYCSQEEIPHFSTCIREGLNCREETIPCFPNYQPSECKSYCSHLAIISEIREINFNLTSCYESCGEDTVCFMKDDGNFEYAWEEDKIKNTKTVCDNYRNVV